MGVEIQCAFVRVPFTMGPKGVLVHKLIVDCIVYTLHRLRRNAESLEQFSFKGLRFEVTPCWGVEVESHVQVPDQTFGFFSQIRKIRRCASV